MNTVLECPYLRMKDAVRQPPLPIQVEATYVTSEVAVDDTINVYHGNYSENELIAQIGSLWRVAYKLVNELLHEVTRPGFSWMLPSYDSDNFLFKIREG